MTNDVATAGWFTTDEPDDVPDDDAPDTDPFPTPPKEDDVAPFEPK